MSGGGGGLRMRFRSTKLCKKKKNNKNSYVCEGQLSVEEIEEYSQQIHRSQTVQHTQMHAYATPRKRHRKQESKRDLVIGGVRASCIVSTAVFHTRPAPGKREIK